MKLQHLGLYDTAHGALTQLYASTSPAAADLGGKVGHYGICILHDIEKCHQYLVPWARVGPSREDVRDPEVGQALWNWCEGQIKDI